MLQLSDAVFEVMEGDARNVLCEAIERHNAEMLVVGSHGYGAIKRFLPFAIPPLFFHIDNWYLYVVIDNCYTFLCLNSVGKKYP